MAVHSASLPHPHSSIDDEDGLICLQPHALDRNCTFFTPLSQDSKDLLKKTMSPHLPSWGLNRKRKSQKAWPSPLEESTKWRIGLTGLTGIDGAAAQGAGTDLAWCQGSSAVRVF